MLKEAGDVTSKIGDCFKNMMPYIFVKVNYHIYTHKYTQYNAGSLLH